ncbi:MAG: GAF domain-containing protein [Actinomycetota bacterium]|nr:GAF domain-containing protein [Actinomycetota bacterium]
MLAQEPGEACTGRASDPPSADWKAAVCDLLERRDYALRWAALPGRSCPDPQDRVGLPGAPSRGFAAGVLNPGRLVADLRAVFVRSGSFSDLRGSAPLRPLLGFAVIAAGAVAVHPQGSDWRFVGLAALVFAIGALVVAVSSARAGSAWLAPALSALSALLAIALLRQGQGGSTSGYGALGMLAVVWVAAVLDRRAVLLMTVCSGLMFALPLVVLGSPMYPSNGWRGAVLWTVVAYLVGMVFNTTVAEQRRQTADARRHSMQVEEMHKAFSAISHVARGVSLGSDARELVCAAVIESTGATLATLVEPRGDGFAITGSAGVRIDAAELRSVQPAASLSAFRTGRRVFIADVAQEPGVSAVIVRATGIVSVVYEPILRDGRSVGVLCVAWATPRSDLDAKSQAVIQFLAAEAGAAIERSDLLSRLDSQARRDQLTALPNRRSWDETLTSAISQTVDARFRALGASRLGSWDSGDYQRKRQRRPLLLPIAGSLRKRRGASNGSHAGCRAVALVG